MSLKVLHGAQFGTSVALAEGPIAGIALRLTGREIGFSDGSTPLSPKNELYFAREREIFSAQETRFIAVSERTKREVVSEYGVSPERISVIYPSVDIERFSPKVRSSLRDAARSRFIGDRDALVIGFVGSGYFRKGLDVVFKLLLALRKNGVRARALVAGRGRQREYRLKASLWGLGADVVFLGAERNVEEVFAASDVVVLPSLYEPFGLAPLEAMACGVPVVVSGQCGIAEILTPGGDSFVIDDSKSLDPAVSFISSSSEILNEVGARARETACRFNTRRYALEISAVYQDLLDSRQRLIRSSAA